MTDWDRLAGMRCTCPPKCTTGDVWGDGPRDCDPGCEPCTLMTGKTYTKPWSASAGPRRVMTPTTTGRSRLRRPIPPLSRPTASAGEVRHPSPADRRTCGLVWSDGWGEHVCSNLDGHDSRHRCHCDSEQ